MKAGYWVKLALGLALIALLCLAAYKLLDGILDFVSKIGDGGGEIVSAERISARNPGAAAHHARIHGGRFLLR